MKLNTEQCMLLIAAAVSTIMTWTAAIDHHVMAWAFFGELVISVGLFAASLRKRKEREIVFRED